MLQVTKDGANISLTGKATGYGDGLFWFGFALLVGAIGVATAMSLLPERLAIGALAVLIVGSFIFNRMRSKQNSSGQVQISAGLLKVKSGMFVHNIVGKTQQYRVEPNDTVLVESGTLKLLDGNGKTKCEVSGFETEKEAQVMQAILQGQQLNKRHANIKMQSN